MAVSAERLAELKARAAEVRAQRQAVIQSMPVTPATTSSSTVPPERLAELKARAAAIKAQRQAAVSISTPKYNTVPTTLVAEPAVANTAQMRLGAIPQLEKPAALLPVGRPQPDSPDEFAGKGFIPQPEIERRATGQALARNPIARTAWIPMQAANALEGMGRGVAMIPGILSRLRYKPGTPARTFWDKYVDYFADPENFAIGKNVEPMTQQVLADAKKHGPASEVGAKILKSAADLVPIIASLGAGELASTAPKVAAKFSSMAAEYPELGVSQFHAGMEAAQKIASPLVRSLAHTGKTAALVASTTPEDLAGRAHAALGISAFGAAGGFASQVPIGKIGQTLLNVGLNALVSSPSYYQALASGGFSRQTLMEVLPGLVQDVGWAMSQGATPEASRRWEETKYLTRTGRYGALDMPTRRKILKNMQDAKASMNVDWVRLGSITPEEYRQSQAAANGMAMDAAKAGTSGTLISNPTYQRHMRLVNTYNAQQPSGEAIAPTAMPSTARATVTVGNFVATIRPEHVALFQQLKPPAAGLKGKKAEEARRVFLGAYDELTKAGYDPDFLNSFVNKGELSTEGTPGAVNEAIPAKPVAKSSPTKLAPKPKGKPVTATLGEIADQQAATTAATTTGEQLPQTPVSSRTRRTKKSTAPAMSAETSVETKPVTGTFEPAAAGSLKVGDPVKIAGFDSAVIGVEGDKVRAKNAKGVETVVRHDSEKGWVYDASGAKTTMQAVTTEAGAEKPTIPVTGGKEVTSTAPAAPPKPKVAVTKQPKAPRKPPAVLMAEFEKANEGVLKPAGDKFVVAAIERTNADAAGFNDMAAKDADVSNFVRFARSEVKPKELTPELQKSILEGAKKVSAYEVKKSAVSLEGVEDVAKQVESESKKSGIKETARGELTENEMLEIMKDEHADIASRTSGAEREAELKDLRRGYHEEIAAKKDATMDAAFKRYVEWAKGEGRVVAKKADVAVAQTKPEVSKPAVSITMPGVQAGTPIRIRAKTKPVVAAPEAKAEPAKPKTPEGEWKPSDPAAINASDKLRVTASDGKTTEYKMVQVGTDPRTKEPRVQMQSLGGQDEILRKTKDGWVNRNGEPVKFETWRAKEASSPEADRKQTADELKKANIISDEEGGLKMTSKDNPFTYLAKRIEARNKAHGLPPLKGNSTSVAGAVQMIADATGRAPKDVWKALTTRYAPIGKRIPSAQLPGASQVAIQRIISAVETAERMQPAKKQAMAEQRGVDIAKLAQDRASILKAGKMSSKMIDALASKDLYHGGTLLSDPTKRTFAEIESQIPQADMNALAQMIEDKPGFDEWDKWNAYVALKHILRGEVRGDAELKTLRLVYGDELVTALKGKQTTLAKVWREITAIANLPRLLMSMGDMSAVLRQSVVETVSHPLVASEAVAQTVRFVFKPEEFADYFHDLHEGHKYASVMRHINLPITDPANPELYGYEEPYISRLIQDGRLPILPNPFKHGQKIDVNLLGHVVRASERAYVGYLTKMRVDLFSNWLDVMRATGEVKNIYAKEGSRDFKIMQDMGNTIAVFTGRGPMPQKLAGAANMFMFAPRLVSSRLQFLNPQWYISSLYEGHTGGLFDLRKESFDSASRIIARRRMGDAVKFLLVGAAALGAAHYAGADVELNPLSTDFGKIRMGNTRFDVWGGEQQLVRTLFQFALNREKNSSGHVVPLRKTFYRNRFNLALGLATNKLSPSGSFLADWAMERTNMGKFDLGQEISSRLTMLWVQDVADAMADKGMIGLFGLPVERKGPMNLVPVPQFAKYQPPTLEQIKRGALAGAAAFGGVGVQTYDAKKKSGGAGTRLGY